MEVVHTYSKDEVRSLTSHVNLLLHEDEDLNGVIPIDVEGEEIFQHIKRGILLNKLLYQINPKVVDISKLIKIAASPFQTRENHLLSLQGCKKLGVRVISIDTETLMNGTPHLVLGLLWQIVRVGLLAKVNLVSHPEILVLDEDKNVRNFLTISPDVILLRWFNYHLKNANSERQVNNFSSDIMDGESYLVLFQQIASHIVPKDIHLTVMDPMERAKLVCEYAEKLGCGDMINPNDIVNGKENLNLAFAAVLFDKFPGLKVVQTVEIPAVAENHALDLMVSRGIEEEEERLRKEQEILSREAELNERIKEFERQKQEFEELKRIEDEKKNENEEKLLQSLKEIQEKNNLITEQNQQLRSQLDNFKTDLDTLKKEKEEEIEKLRIRQEQDEEEKKWVHEKNQKLMEENEETQMQMLSHSIALQMNHWRYLRFDKCLFKIVQVTNEIDGDMFGVKLLEDSQLQVGGIELPINQGFLVNGVILNNILKRLSEHSDNTFNRPPAVILLRIMDDVALPPDAFVKILDKIIEDNFKVSKLFKPNDLLLLISDLLGKPVIYVVDVY
eukprot:TRINITY_DN150_c0_g1_i2.p1 TRINITY_DN150_c0_g1~~TRINITY_DN150_c0_g1_i2.p1  ORF type:complete len:559 (+),score=128.86 TRINITY_DN150_c0_g1_i2:1523-3199(+)